MNIITETATSLILALTAVGLVATQAYARPSEYAQQECNARIQRGVVADNQAAFNACVEQLDEFFS